MSRARFLDWQRRLRSKKEHWRSTIERFSFEGIPALGTAEFSIGSPLTVLCGPNGVGKTTLLRALWVTLDPSGAANPPIVKRKLAAGSAVADLIVDGNVSSAEVEFGIPNYRVVRSVSVTVTHVDGAAEAIKSQHDFCRFESAEEITNGSGVKELKPAQIAEINYILHRDYRSIALYEVEMDSIVPYFEVAYGDDRYDSRTMGSGEAAALYIWWALERAEANSFILIEEPEAYLSYGCQESLAEHIIALTVKKKLCTIISSHSAALITSVPKECVRLVARGQSGIQILGDNLPPILLKSIGVASPLRAIILVEDSAGQIFCRSLIERFDSALSQSLAIEIAGSEGEITLALRHTQKIRSGPKFVGAYDADMIGNLPKEVSNIAFTLPGTEPLEKVFRALVSEKVSEIEDATGKENVSAILSVLEGKDHHDWYDQITKELGLNKPQLFYILFSIWISNVKNKNAASDAYNRLMTIIEGEAEMLSIALQ